MRIALAGNPNSGKTTLFNALTGQVASVGNWSGVTVEIQEVIMKEELGNEMIVDLPGAYSLSPFSKEEALSVDFVTSANCDVIVNIVDISNLSRSLFFSTQLAEERIPMVIALNKMDILEDELDMGKLARALGCPVYPISAEQNEGIKELVHLATTATKPAKREKLLTDEARFAYIEEILQDIYEEKEDRNAIKLGDRVDRVLADSLWGLPIFLGILSVMFYLAERGFMLSQPGLTQFLDKILDSADQYFSESPVFFRLLAVEGVLGALSTLITFIPLMGILFFLLAMLEDCGYIARVTVVMDHLLKKIGLTGKGMIPLMEGTRSGKAGVLSTRTTEEENLRKRLCILAPMVPCGRKWPMIALFTGLFFQHTSYMGVYLFGMLLVFLGGFILEKTCPAPEESPIFIMELPQYKVPRLTFGLQHMWENIWGFLQRIVTVLLISSVLVWFLQQYSFGLAFVTEGQDSVLGKIGTALAPIFVPLGFGTWQLVVTALSGFVAKENGVVVLCLLYACGLENLGNAETLLWTDLSTVSALSFLVFFLFSPPCMGVLKAMKEEMQNKSWFYYGVSLQLCLGYASSFLVYQLGTLLFYGEVGQGALLGAQGVIFLVVLCRYCASKLEDEEELEEESEAEESEAEESEAEESEAEESEEEESAEEESGAEESEAEESAEEESEEEESEEEESEEEESAEEESAEEESEAEESDEEKSKEEKELTKK